MWISCNVATCGLLRLVTWGSSGSQYQLGCSVQVELWKSSVDLSMSQHLLDRSDKETFRKHMRGHEIQRKLHDVRKFLRFVALSACWVGRWLDRGHSYSSLHALFAALVCWLRLVEWRISEELAHFWNLLQMRSGNGYTHALSVAMF